MVLDCFMGSGTTAVACRNLKRNFIGFELDKNYYETAINRVRGIEVEPVKKPRKKKKKKENQLNIWDFIGEENEKNI